MKRPRMDKAAPGRCYRDDLRFATNLYLPGQGLPLQSDDGRIRWTDRLLAITALLMAWEPAEVLKKAFRGAREVVVQMYPTRKRPGTSYQGFVKVLCKKSAGLLSRVTAKPRRIMQSLLPSWRWREWVPIAVDGSRINTPRTAANEAAFGCAGKDKTTPQILLTALFHVGQGLPWTWRREAGRGDERAALRTMIPSLPERTLLLADAAYTGYDLLQAVCRAGHDFIVRVGANVSLLRELGACTRERKDTVYLWPQSKRAGEPLVLRLVKVRDRAKKKKHVYLVTNVLDESRLSQNDVGEMYRRRWRIEVMFRTLKDTLCARKMRSQRPDHALVELDWALTALWLLGLMTAEQMAAHGRVVSKWSPAKALDVVQTAMRHPAKRRPAGGIRGQLCFAVIDSYPRRGNKVARNWPHKKTQKPPDRPNIRTATPAEVQKAKRLTELKRTG